MFIRRKDRDPERSTTLTGGRSGPLLWWDGHRTWLPRLVNRVESQDPPRSLHPIADRIHGCFGFVPSLDDGDGLFRVQGAAAPRWLLKQGEVRLDPACRVPPKGL